MVARARAAHLPAHTTTRMDSPVMFGAAVRRATEDRIEMARWRGQQEATQAAMVNRMDSFANSTAERLEALHKDMSRRFDDQEVEMSEIKRQVQYTNGSVRDLKEWRASLEGIQSGEQQVEVRVRQDQMDRLQARRFTVSQMIAAGSAFGAMTGLPLAIVHFIH